MNSGFTFCSCGPVRCSVGSVSPVLLLLSVVGPGGKEEAKGLGSRALEYLLHGL